LTTDILQFFGFRCGVLLGCFKLEILRYTSKTKQSCTSKVFYEITDMFYSYQHYEITGMFGIL